MGDDANARYARRIAVPTSPPAGTSSQRADTRTYLPALDGVRAAAVLAVFAAHSTFGNIPGGIVGVEMFFVLSGYLITTLLISEYRREGRISIRRFYLRRAARLLPALGLLTVLVLVLHASDASVLPATDVPAAIAKVWLDVGNWFVAAHRDELGLFGHTWSLAIEEQFYLLWPLALTFVLTRGLTGGRVMSIVLVLAALSYVTQFVVSGHNPNAAYYRSDTRAGALLIGCALALAIREFPARLGPIVRRSVALLGSLAIAVVVLTIEHSSPTALLVVAMSTAAIIAHIAVGSSVLTRWLSLPPAVWIGKRSYGIYLYHWPIVVYFTDVRMGIAMHGTPGLVLGLAIRLGLTLAAAAVSYRFVEQPILRRTRRLTTPPAPALASV